MTSRSMSFFQQAIEDLESVILGENISMQEVRSSLEFPSSVLDGKVKADWFTDDLGLIDEKGNLVGEPAEGGTQVQITVNFSCQDREMDYRFSVCVFPPVRSEEEKQQKQIRELLQSEEQKRVQEEQLRLPGEIEGKKLEWKKKRIARADDCGSGGYHSIVYLDAGRRKITGSSQEKSKRLLPWNMLPFSIN